MIVPAYNEEINLEYTLDSIVKANYPNKQVIIVDNGSTDRTYSIASAFKRKFSNNSNVISVIRKKRKGKPSALNYALRFAKGEIVVLVDSDSRIEKNALTEIVKQFQNPDVNAVAGNGKISNRCNTITKCLALEMILGVNLLKPPYSLVGMVMIVPGAFGAFRKKAMLERGLYDKDILTEDFDMTVKLLKGGGGVVATPATCYSKTPTSLRGFYYQRTRWMRGNFQTFIKHSNILINGRYGMLHKFAYPALVLSFLLIPTMDMVVVGLTVYAIFKGFIEPLIMPFVLFTLLQVLVASIAIVMDGNEKDWKIILYSPLFVVGYRHILDLIIVESIFDVLTRKNLKWTSISSKGSIDTSSQILMTIITTPLKLIDKIASRKLTAIINNPAKARYTLIIFYLVFAAGIAAIFFTEVYFGENGHIPSLSATKFIFANNKVLYDGSYIASLKKMSHLIPNNETLLTSSESPQTGYFSGYHDVFATGPNELNSLLRFALTAETTSCVNKK